jgi:FtsP/CotA-like multicopper oxidase with cupredoxin domain
VAPPDFAQPAGWDARIAAAEAADLDPSPDVVEVHLEARKASLQIKPGMLTEVWTYNGQLPGPVIRARKGQKLVVKLTNHLPEATTIHWHGIRVPAAMDGTPASQAPVEPGETFTYAFELKDAGTYWYHPHVRSAGQVGAGLYGALVVEDPEEPFLGDSLVLVLSDISLEDDGRLSPFDQSGWFGDYFGREGDPLVNGRVLPTVLVRRGLPQRWRLVNAARSRFYKLAWPGLSWVRISSDGGLISQPQTAGSLFLAPGERAEVMLLPAGQPGERIEVLAHDADRFHIGTPQAGVPLIRLELSSDPPVARALWHEPLRQIDRIDVAGAQVRTLDLMEKAADGGAVLGINGLTAAEAPPLMTRVGATEIWVLTNSTPYDHPFHLHGYFFQVLDVDGVPPAALEWKDTIVVGPKRRVRMAVRFEDRPGMWMFHCHILDHADLGMMGMLHVVP